jgi:hypothetical protein
MTINRKILAQVELFPAERFTLIVLGETMTSDKFSLFKFRSLRFFSTNQSIN